MSLHAEIDVHWLVISRSWKSSAITFPKWESLKNKSGKVACFSSQKNDRQLTSFYQQSTTNSPSKNHVLHPVFAKTPSKKGVNQPRKKLLHFIGSKKVLPGGLRATGRRDRRG